ncbi:MAG: hypothetical protein Q9220_007829 [cf. Caloplaca sp. 1 TL-2023]
MKVMIISAIIGAAILSLPGVTGVVIPAEDVKRSELAGLNFEVSEAAAPALLTKRSDNEAIFLVTKDLEKRTIDVESRAIVSSSPANANPILAARAAATPGCHAKAKPFYFTDRAAAVCNAELVKGSQIYQQYYPGTTWNLGLMHLCFENAGCDGGLSF